MLLIADADFAIHAGPIAHRDDAIALSAGMLMIPAIAIRCGIGHPSRHDTTHRFDDGSTTQIMIDIAHLLHGLEGEAKLAAR